MAELAKQKPSLKLNPITREEAAGWITIDEIAKMLECDKGKSRRLMKVAGVYTNGRTFGNTVLFDPSNSEIKKFLDEYMPTEKNITEKLSALMKTRMSSEISALANDFMKHFHEMDDEPGTQLLYLMQLKYLRKHFAARDILGVEDNELRNKICDLAYEMKIYDWKTEQIDTALDYFADRVAGKLRKTR